MKQLFLACFCLFLAAWLVNAGWNDLVFSSSENLMDARQGRAISLSLNISNSGYENGYAVYILNVTLHPSPCINNGLPVTSSAGILCPKGDLTCKNRFPISATSMVLNFTNLPTDPNCSNGLKEYYFTLEGSVEQTGNEGKWFPSVLVTNTSKYHIRFIGPDVCGDGLCGGNESCINCAVDCGRCPECESGTRACRNNSVYECVGGFFTHMIEECRYGCEEVDGKPTCRRICTEGEKRCLGDGQTLQTCRNNEWINETCVRGCRDNACESDLCAGVLCMDYCENSVAYSYGSCDPSNGKCVYYSIENCEHGCLGAVCAPASATPTPVSSPMNKGSVFPCLGSGIALFVCLLISVNVR